MDFSLLTVNDLVGIRKFYWLIYKKKIRVYWKSRNCYQDISLAIFGILQYLHGTLPKNNAFKFHKYIRFIYSDQYMYMRQGISLYFTSKRHIHGGLWFYTWQNIKDQTFSVSALLSLVWIKVYNTLYILFQIQQYLYFQLIFFLIIMAVIVNIQILFCLNGTVSFFYITNLITPYKIKYLLFL